MPTSSQICRQVVFGALGTGSDWTGKRAHHLPRWSLMAHHQYNHKKSKPLPPGTQITYLRGAKEVTGTIIDGLDNGLYTIRPLHKFVHIKIKAKIVKTWLDLQGAPPPPPPKPAPMGMPPVPKGKPAPMLYFQVSDLIKQGKLDDDLSLLALVVSNRRKALRLELSRNLIAKK